MRSKFPCVYFVVVLVILKCGVEAFFLSSSCSRSRSARLSSTSKLMSTKSGKSSATDKGEKVLAKNRRDLWKEISSLEKQAVDVLSSESVDGIKSRKEAFKLLSKSVALKKNDAFMILASKYSEAQTQEKTGDNDTEKNRDDDMDILEEMYKVGLPPHLEYIVSSRRIKAGLDQAPVQEEDEEGTVVTEAEAVVDEITGGEKGEIEEIEEFVQCEEVEEESTVSEVITEKVRVRVQVSLILRFKGLSFSRHCWHLISCGVVH